MSFDTDQPKTEEKQDRFQRYGFAKRVANMVASNTAENSLVVGLYGKWGEGKTTVMNFIKKELPEECLIINFNPWIFSDQENLVKVFFSEIADALDKSITTVKESIGEILNTYGNIIGNIKIAGIGVNGLEALGEKLKKTNIEKLKHRVNQIIKDSERKIIVCIDDIDRLDVKEIQYIFKLIKLVGDFTNTSYILAFDDNMVATALAPMYGDGQKSTGYQFLEKIIQVPLVIPKATKTALIKYTIELIDETIKKVGLTLTVNEVSQFRTVFDENLIPAVINPRLALRYINSLHFSLPLLIGEVSTIDFMLAEALKTFYPEAYDFMRSNAPLFLTDNMRERGAFRPDAPYKGTIQTEIKNTLEKFSEKDARRIMNVWRDLFPQYAYITANEGYSEDSWRDWYRKKRICSGRYFERYFTYTVVEGEVSDLFFDEFLKEIEFLDFESAKKKMAILFDEPMIEDTIFKLRLWEDSLNQVQSAKLSELLASIEKSLPEELYELSSFTTRSQGLKVIAQLIINIDKIKRTEHAIKVFDIVCSLQSAMEINYWLFYKNEKQIDKYFSYKNEQRIHRYFLDRFKLDLTHEAFFNLVSDGNLWRIMKWWNEIDPKEFQQYIIDLLQTDSQKAIQLIKVFAATIISWGGSEGREAYKGGFDENRYDSLASLIDPSIIYNILNKAGGYRLQNVALQIISDQERMTDRELANVYMQFYEKKHLTLGDI